MIFKETPPPVSLTRVRRRSVVHCTVMQKRDEEIRVGEQEDTFNATVSPHGGPWLTYLRSKHNQGTQLAIIKILSTAIERKLKEASRARKSELEERRLMSAHRGSAGSTWHPATSEMRDLMGAQLGFCAGSKRDPAT